MHLSMTPGETVLVRTRTHTKALARPALWALFISATVSALFRFVETNPYGVLYTTVGRYIEPHLPLGITIVATLFVLVKVLVPALRWHFTVYTITTRRLCWRTGVIVRTGRDIPLHRINDVTYEIGLTDRILGCGTLVVSDATEKSGLRLHDIPDVRGVSERLHELIHDARER